MKRKKKFCILNLLQLCPDVEILATSIDDLTFGFEAVTAAEDTVDVWALVFGFIICKKFLIRNYQKLVQFVTRLLLVKILFVDGWKSTVSDTVNLAKRASTWHKGDIKGLSNI